MQPSEQGTHVVLSGSSHRPVSVPSTDPSHSRHVVASVQLEQPAEHGAHLPSLTKEPEKHLHRQGGRTEGARFE